MLQRTENDLQRHTLTSHDNTDSPAYFSHQMSCKKIDNDSSGITRKQI